MQVQSSLPFKLLKYHTSLCITTDIIADIIIFKEEISQF